jgi:hypothetical protein
MQFPIPRQEFVDPGSRVLGDAGEDIGQPSLRIDIVHFGRDNDAIHGGGALSAAIRRGLIVPGFRRRKSQSPIRFIR